MSRVMLVDDEEAILKSLKRILRLAPCTFGGKTFTLDVETYTSPQEALAAARRDDYDLFISDYRMPIMDGIEFTRACRSRPAGQNTPIIVLTTENGAEIKAEGRRAGASAWMVKPFEPNTLLGLVARYQN